MSFTPTYENGVPVFRPSLADFRDFRAFINHIEPIGMTSGIVKVVPPPEWLADLPKTPTAQIEQISIRNPIEQRVTLDGGRGVFSIDNVEKRKRYTMKQWFKQCNLLSNQPPTRRGEKQRVLGKYEAPSGGFINYDDADFNEETLTDLEQKYWKGITYGGAPMYGADLPGSLFKAGTKEWNVADLDSLLSALPEKLLGVNDAYLYCGMWKATFAWHLEDVDLPSINYIHFGAPKQWYSIPQSHHEQFGALMSALWPDDSAKCAEFLRHKTFLTDPAFIESHGIPVNRIVHRQREFMITFPYGYHAGFNYGFNVAESVNFAHDSWLEIGAKARKCTCVSHSVGINVDDLISRIKAGAGWDKTSGGGGPGSGGATTTATLNSVQSGLGLFNHRLGKCVLCPHIYDNRYVSNRHGSASAHINCANMVPETWIAGNTLYGLETIEKERFGLKCAHCRLSLGCCFQCSSLKCTRAYHASCAAAAGVDYHDPHRPFCRHHRNKDIVSSLRPAGEVALPGDVVQYRQNKLWGAGLVINNNGQDLELTSLPNPAKAFTLPSAMVTDVFAEVRRGPFIEALVPRKRKTERDVNAVKIVKAEVGLLSPPASR